MNVRKEYRIKLSSSDAPSTGNARNFTTYLLDKINTCFGSSKELITYSVSSSEYYYLIPLFNHDGTESTRFYIGTSGSNTTSAGNFGFCLFLKKEDATYKKIGIYPTYSYDIHHQTTLIKSVFSGSVKSMSNYLPSCIVFSPIPNGYMLGTLLTSDYLDDGVPIFGYYFLEGIDISDQKTECLIVTKDSTDNSVYIYPNEPMGGYDTYMCAQESNNYPSGLSYDYLFASRIMGQYTFDAYSAKIRPGFQYEDPLPITANYTRGTYYDSDSPIVSMFNYKKKTYLSSLNPVGNQVPRGNVLIFEKPDWWEEVEKNRVNDGFKWIKNYTTQMPVDANRGWICGIVDNQIHNVLPSHYILSATNPDGDNWTRSTDVPTPDIGYTCCGVYNNEIHIFGEARIGTNGKIASGGEHYVWNDYLERWDESFDMAEYPAVPKLSNTSYNYSFASIIEHKGDLYASSTTGYLLKYNPYASTDEDKWEKVCMNPKDGTSLAGWSNMLSLDDNIHILTKRKHYVLDGDQFVELSDSGFISFDYQIAVGIYKNMIVRFGYNAYSPYGERYYISTLCDGEWITSYVNNKPDPQMSVRAVIEIGSCLYGLTFRDSSTSYWSKGVYGK